jgi:hypothetical protein
MKIFQIGFNRCGTVSLHYFFEMSGIPAVHWDEGALARSMYAQYKQDKPLLARYPDFTFFSDMEADIAIAGKPSWLYAHIDFYKLLDAQYPGSKFILNTRRLEDWLVSRSRFGEASPSWYLDYAKRQYNTSAENVHQIWKNQWVQHHNDVLAYFKDRPEDLLVYDIDNDNADKIREFFKPYLLLTNKPFPKFHPSRPIPS